MSDYGPIPNQRVRSTTEIELTSGKKVMIDAGSFVKFVRREYLCKYPAHPFEKCDERYQVIVLTKFGLALIERSALEWNVL